MFLLGPVRNLKFRSINICRKWPKVWGRRSAVFDLDRIAAHSRLTLNNMIRQGVNLHVRGPFISATIKGDVAHEFDRLMQETRALM